MRRARDNSEVDLQALGGPPVRLRAGSREELVSSGCITAKAASQPICVFWDGERAYALDDRCPHMGFPLHRGTVESGIVTCHWHHARFDLASGGTFDPFADDVRAYPVELEGDDVYVLIPPDPDPASAHRRRLNEGLEQGLTLVIAKAVLGLLATGAGTAEVLGAGVEFGTEFRDRGWGSGLTVLTAMGNVLPFLDPEDRPLALVHGLAFVSRDTRGHPPRFPLAPLDGTAAGLERLSAWYRRFIETRSSDAAERTLASAVAGGHRIDAIEKMMTAAVTDHVFLDGGHTIDFTNKAFEALALLDGGASAETLLTTLVLGTATASRAEESGQWRHPWDLPAMLGDCYGRIDGLLESGATLRPLSDAEVSELAWSLLADDPNAVVGSLRAAMGRGATAEQVGRAVAYAAALRIVRFHTQNDHGDWDVVHHGFTAANALHQCLVRAPSAELVRGVFHLALRIFLDRFLNVPPARLPADHLDEGFSGDLTELSSCWDEQGRVDDAGSIAYSFLRNGGQPARLVEALGHALLSEDAEFHWFQTYEAAVRQHQAWPRGSEEAALVLVAAARFLAAHTPTRRELPKVVAIATRLRRGESLFADA